MLTHALKVSSGSAVGAVNGLGHTAQPGVQRHRVLRQDSDGAAPTKPLRLSGHSRRGETTGREWPRDEWIDIPIPPLVPEDMFALAAERLADNKRFAPRRTIEPRLVKARAGRGGTQTGGDFSPHVGGWH